MVVGWVAERLAVDACKREFEEERAELKARNMVSGFHSSESINRGCAPDRQMLSD